MRRANTHTIAAIADVIATHTSLTLPASPLALAGCLLSDEADFVGVYDDEALGRRCVTHVLAHIDQHIAVDPECVDADELARALYRV
jgi:hypothetical protein